MRFGDCFSVEVEEEADWLGMVRRRRYTLGYRYYAGR